MLYRSVALSRIRMPPIFERRKVFPGSAVLCGIALAVSCTGSPSGPGSAAAALCQRAAGAGQHLVASYPTTVGEIRNWTVGPGFKPAAAWPSDSQNDFAAWCWLDTTGKGTRTVVAMSPGKKTIGFATGDPGALLLNPQGPAVP